jgi:hypothetical protein
MSQEQKLDPLTRAAIRYGTDKYGGHLYTPVYHSLFEKRRDEALKLLEIGTGGYDFPQAGGLSLRMWLEYFPYAEITGLDIQEKSLELPPRARIYQGSQVDPEMLTKLSRERGPFDIIIDDGSHIVEHMIESFMRLYPLMAPDGIYAVEDTQTCFHNSRNGRDSIFDLANQLSLAMHKLEGFDITGVSPSVAHLGEITKCVSIYRNIIVFQRGTNTYPSNFGLDLNNQEARDVFDNIAAEGVRTPSPGSMLARVDMLLWAQQYEELAELARQAMTRFPHERAMLHELARILTLAKKNGAEQDDTLDQITIRLAALG